MECGSEQGGQVCLRVLQTLLALLAGNEASRNRMQEDIGYDTLYSAIVRVVGPQGFSNQLLMQLLSLVLEVHRCLKNLQGAVHTVAHTVSLTQ